MDLFVMAYLHIDHHEVLWEGCDLFWCSESRFQCCWKQNMIVLRRLWENEPTFSNFLHLPSHRLYANEPISFAWHENIGCCCIWTTLSGKFPLGQRNITQIPWKFSQGKLFCFCPFSSRVSMIRMKVQSTTQKLLSCEHWWVGGYERTRISSNK